MWITLLWNIVEYYKPLTRNPYEPTREEGRHKVLNTAQMGVEE